MNNLGERRRPPIPTGVRIKVIDRQLAALGIEVIGHWRTRAEELRIKLIVMFGDERSHCDHRPALILRTYHHASGTYQPFANDPDYLEHVTVHDHHLKTNVRGLGAQRSDTAERMHRRRMDENRGLRKRRPKAKIAQRKNSWPKGRKMRSRKGWR
jgi:hypothetical protein